MPNSYQPISSFKMPDLNSRLPINPELVPDPSPKNGGYAKSITAESTPMYKINPMGVPAASPQTNVALISNTIPKNQVQKNTPTPTTVPTSPAAPTTAMGPSSQVAGAFPAILGGLVGNAIQNPDVQKALADKLAFEKQYLDVTQNIGSRPNPFGFMTGVGALEKNRYAQLEPAYTQNIQNALGAQTNTLGGLYDAANLASPRDVSPANSLVAPDNGKSVYQGLGLTGLGIAQQNIAQGSKFHQNAADLDTTLKSIDTLTPTISNFLQTSGLNDNRSPWINQSVKTYIAQNQNSGNATSLQQFMNALKTYQASIISASGLTPTEVTNTALSTDPSDLSIVDLIPFVQNLKNEGQIRLKPLQDAASASYGANTAPGGVYPYTGSPANPSVESSYAPNAQTAANNLIGNNDIAKGTLGTVMNAGSGGLGVISGIWDVLSKIK